MEVETNMKDLMRVCLGIIGITVALILFPTIITQANTLYTAAGSTYTGMRPLVAVSPLIIYVGLILGSGWMTFSGVRQARGGRRHTK